MALSGTYTFEQNANKIISAAMRKVGKLATGQVATGQQLNDAMAMLNAMVQHWQSRHVFLWTVEEHTVNTTASQKFVVLDAEVIYVPEAFIRISNNDHPIQMKTFQWYQELARKDNEGRPTMAAVDSQHATPMKMYFKKPPDQVYDVHYMGVRKLQDFKTGKDADFPSRWVKPMIFGLSADMSYDRGLPVSQVQLLEAKAEQLFLEAKGGDNEMTDPEFMEGVY